MNDNSLSSFQAALGTDPSPENFYYIRVNGLGPLRQRDIDLAEYFYSFYYDRTSDFSKFFLITMIIGITLIVASMFVIMPKTLSVYQTNIQVLSLFGFIHPKLVKDLAAKCDEFINMYLDEIMMNREMSYLDSEYHMLYILILIGELEELNELTIQPDNSGAEEQKPLSSVNEASIESLHQNYTTQMKEFPEKLDISWKERSPSNKLAIPDHDSIMVTSQRSSFKDNKTLTTPITVALSMNKDKAGKDNKQTDKKDDKDGKENKEEEDEDYYYLLDRSNKLKISKVHRKKTVIFQISSFALIFLAFFVGDYISEMFLMTQYRHELQHLKIISQRSSNLKFVNLFTLEELAEDNLASVYPASMIFGNVSSNG